MESNLPKAANTEDYTVTVLSGHQQTSVVGSLQITAVPAMPIVIYTTHTVSLSLSPMSNLTFQFLRIHICDVCVKYLRLTTNIGFRKRRSKIVNCVKQQPKLCLIHLLHVLIRANLRHFLMDLLLQPCERYLFTRWRHVCFRVKVANCQWWECGTSSARNRINHSNTLVLLSVDFVKFAWIIGLSLDYGVAV